MKSIKIVTKGGKLGRIVPSGRIAYNIFRRVVGESWTTYNQSDKTMTLGRFIEFHNDNSHIQIEALESEQITLD